MLSTEECSALCFHLYLNASEYVAPSKGAGSPAAVMAETRSVPYGLVPKPLATRSWTGEAAAVATGATAGQAVSHSPSTVKRHVPMTPHTSVPSSSWAEQAAQR